MKELFKDKKNILITLLSIILCLLIIIIIISVTKVDNKTNINPYDIRVKSNDNFVFLGDSITDFYPLEELYENVPVINSGISGYTTDDILNSIDKMVSIYNPTKVILLIGTNDLQQEKTPEYIVNNIKRIVKEILKKRPNTKIYIESVYPVNNTDNEKISHGMVGIRKNSDIRKINKGIKKICEENNYTYINLYDKLTDKDGNLKLEYTEEGLHMSDLGYLKITKLLYPYLQD